ncbi:MAG: D-alanine--D-alanine ligase [Oscillospiraceae bacterium]|nr:D-alanine--D-alanine ligase [Oscillospiraceae bacterium]
MKTLCVIFGGVSNEHDVSLRSATSVLKNVDRRKYSVRTLGITKDGRWLLYDGPVELIKTGEWADSSKTVPAILSPDRCHGGLLVLGEGGPTPVKVDVVFGVLHGKNGEDGTMQGLLELAGIPYVGCKVLASALCMDKAVAHAVLTGAGIKKTVLAVVYPRELENFKLLETRLAAELGYPMFVKPANSGSSVGISRATNADELHAAVGHAFEHDSKAVVEQEVRGQEIECSVIGGADPIVAEVVGEVAPPGGFYCYESKYQNDSAKLYIPARLDAQTVARVRVLAARAYEVTGCQGFARVDFFVQEDGEIVLNEINTIPGFTSISIFPKLFEAAGVPYREIISKLIEYALESAAGLE